MGLKSKLGENVGVVIVDMQAYYLEDFSSSNSIKESQILRFLNKGAKKMIRYQQKIIGQCANENVSLYLIRDITQKDPINPIVSSSMLVSRNYLIDKEEDDSFKETELDDCLKRNGVDTLLLMGINSGACVKETAETALDKKYKIATGKNLILDHHKRRYEDSVKWFKKNGVWIEHPERTLFR